MMMRPACAYPPVIQSGLPIGPTDMYGERDGFGFGLMTNQPPASMQTMASAPAGLYPVPSNGPTAVLSSANPQTFSQQLHSTYPVSAAYSQLPVQSAPYSAQLSADIMTSGGQLPHGYPQTQQSAQYSNLMNANHEKLISQNLPTTGYTRNVGLANGPNMSMPSSYGLISGPGPNSVGPLPSASAQLPPQRLPSGGSSMGSSGNGRTILPQTTMPGRSAGSRAASGLPDSNGFSSQSMYSSYPSGATPLQSVTAVGSGPGGGHNVQVPYSIAMSNSGMPVTMSPMLNKTSMLPVANYGPSQPMSVQNVPGPVGRPSVMAPGIQPSPVYASQQPRITSASANYAATGFVGQPYAQSPSLSFRTGTHTVVGAPPQSVSMLSRPMDPSSPLTNKEQLGSNCMGMHPCVVQPQQQRPSLSSQLPPCSSAPSSGSPNPCASFSPVVTGKSLRPTATVSVGQPMFNSMTSCGPHASVTPPGCAGGLLINGQSAVIGTMNGCVTIGGQETDVKLTSGIPDGCYLTNRPMSSGTRDPHLSIMTVNGPIGSGSDLLISPTFPMSNNLNASATMSYATNQQIPVLSGEFDVLSSNPSPMMMMAMPSSSPVPGATLINGGLPAGVMIANSTPAPPPYHHQSGSLAGCRSMGPSSFFSPSGMPPVTITTSVHMNTAPTICAPSHDGSGMGVGVLTNERTYLNMPVEPMQVVTGGKSAQPGTTKSAARPKRTRANKNASGGVRASKANAKKTATAAASAATPPAAGMTTLPVQDPFVMNIRMPMQAQQTARQKLPTWNMYPSSVATNFPSGMISPPMSMALSADGRPGCSSPASFSTCNGMLMRPNSGPPLNPSFTSMPHGGCQMLPTGPADVINRLSSSPRLYSSVPMQPPQPQQQQQQQQQQQYLNSSLPTSISPVGASFPGVSVSHSSQPLNTMTLTNPASHPQLQSGYTGSVQMTNARVVPTSMHFQPQTTGSLQIMASNQIQAPNRTLLQSATHTPTTSPYTVEPTSVGERFVGAPYTTPGAPPSSSTDMPPSSSTSDTDRLVCPITNGMVWGPTQIQLTDVLHHFLPDGVYVRRFEFDLTANHLNTIVGRSDLDIVVCSHLLSEPLQVCHWPSDAVQIRFNEFLLRLDRGSVSGGQSAHKVACVKQLCRPGRNQLEIAILGLGEDPGQPATINKRRITAATLETHRFAAFMAHMPALNVLLDGLKRRRPAGVSALCDIIEGRAGLRASSAGSAGGPTPPPRTTPLVAELSLICPVFRTRMNVPGRITGCEHVEAFDMEAFLRREVLWPRLNCPICRHKSPAGLDGLCIDTTIMNAVRLVHPAIESILVRSDGYWRLPPPICLDLPPDIDQWQPIVGPLTEPVTQAFESMAMVRSTQESNRRFSLAPVPGSGGQPHSDWSSIQPNNQLAKSQSNTGMPTRNKPSSMVPSVPITPSKETTCSSPWHHGSDSPSVVDRMSGPLADQRTLEGSTGSKPPSVSRPSSQPISWHSVHSSPTEQSFIAVSQSGQSPRLIMDSSCTTLQQHQRTDPSITGQSVPPRLSVLHTDGIPFGTNSEGLLKTRRCSTGSTRIGLTGSDSLRCLAAVPENSVAPRPGWSDPIVCASESNSPSRFPPASLHPSSSSLPTSPAITARLTSNYYPVSTIPGVSTGILEQPSYSTTQLTTSMIKGPEPATISVTRDQSGSNANSPSHVGVPVSSMAAITSTAIDDSRTSLLAPSPADRKRTESVAVAPEEEFGKQTKKHTSSLNMGLDFLLSEEQPVPDQTTTMGLDKDDSDQVAQNTTCPPSVAVPVSTQSDRFAECGSERSDFRHNKRSFSPHSPVATVSSTDSSSLSIHGSLGQSYACANVQPVCQTDSFIVPSSDDMQLDASVKRVKLDPSVVDLEASCQPSSKEDRHVTLSFPKTDQVLNHDQLTAISCRTFEKEPPKSSPEESLKQAGDPFGVVSNGPNAIVNYKSEENCMDSSCVALPFLLSAELDDDRLCNEAIRSLSARIDRIEVFLDEAYIQFVESFPCT